jgi:hypothetical protein
METFFKFLNNLIDCVVILLILLLCTPVGWIGILLISMFAIIYMN